MSAEMLCGLNEKPAGVGITMTSDGAVVAVVAGLAGGRDETKIACGVVGRGETGEIAQGGEDGGGDAEINARQGHQQLNAGIAKGEGSELVIESGDLGFERGQQTRFALDHGFAGIVKRKTCEPGQTGSIEQIGD